MREVSDQIRGGRHSYTDQVLMIAMGAVWLVFGVKLRRYWRSWLLLSCRDWRGCPTWRR